LSLTSPTISATGLNAVWEKKTAGHEKATESRSAVWG